jgi:hypothetical protein
VSTYEHAVVWLEMRPGERYIAASLPTGEKKYRGTEDVLAVLNKLGTDGWALVAVEPRQGGKAFYWLRRRWAP